MSIARDVFGKPKAITGSGGGKSATRSYVYDQYDRLCKTIEPETNATVQDYDLANNVAWRASGLVLPSTISCDTGSVPLAKKITFGYDLVNQLESTTYGDASPNIARTYWADGLPKTVSSGGTVWTYTYNPRRQSETEVLAYGGTSYGITRAYDANGSLRQLKYPDNTVVDYSPNALGAPTQVGAFASAVSYYPNGAIKGFTYGNGIVHSLKQSMRGLPELSADAGVLNDKYAFDANGNVKSIIDNQEGGASNRVMDYDGLDRLKWVNAPAMWGDAYYDYDALDNLVSSNLTGGSGIARSMLHEYDASNKLERITGTGGFAYIYGYDSQGNISQRGAQSFVFDLGNRISSAPGKSTYGYDGLGRRTSIVGLDGTNRLQMYAHDGKLVYAGPTSSVKTKYVYLNNHVIAEVGGAGTIYNHTDALGSPVARTSSAAGLISRTRYEPYGGTASGTQPTIDFTGHVNDVDTGLTYMQQRYYDPVAGRFLSIDPVTTDANTGGSFNRYAYANNSPYKYVDPDGREGTLSWTAPDRVTFTVKYALTGSTPSFTAAQLNARIALDFSGRATINGTNVTMIARAIQVASPGPGVNTVNVVPDTAGVTRTGRAEINGIGGNQITLGAGGVDAANVKTASHELGGHGGGAGDQYKDGVAANGTILTADVPGRANIMKDLSGHTSNTQTRTEIIKAPTNRNSCAAGVAAANGGC